MMHSTLGWVKGKSKATCKETCAAIGLPCNTNILTSLDIIEKVCDAFQEVGYKCKNIAKSCNNINIPFSTGRSREDYFFWEVLVASRAQVTALELILHLTTAEQVMQSKRQSQRPLLNGLRAKDTQIVNIHALVSVSHATLI